MLHLLANGTPRFPTTTGKDVVEPVSYVWSGNTAALIGAMLCALLLIAWAKYVWIPRVQAAEEEK